MNKRCSPLWIWLSVLTFAFAPSCSRPSTHKSGIAPILSAPVGTQTLTGRVIRIADGDTITVLDATNTQHRVRLQGIDAPESHQAFGAQSKQNLSAMIFDRDVTIEYE